MHVIRCMSTDVDISRHASYDILNYSFVIDISRHASYILVKGNVAVYKVLNIEKRHNYAS